VAIILRVIADNNSRDVNFGRLERDGKSVERVFWAFRNAVISDDGIGQDENLALVGWIGEGLGVPDHAYRWV
jgi:hypothetical protein